MADDPREVLTAALDPFVSDPPLSYLGSDEELADVALAALHAAGWRVVRKDDLQWLVDSLEHIDSAYWPRGDEIPPGVRALMEGEPTESDGELLVEGDR